VISLVQNVLKEILPMSWNYAIICLKEQHFVCAHDKAVLSSKKHKGHRQNLCIFYETKYMTLF
jgi:hypothetical protein